MRSIHKTNSGWACEVCGTIFPFRERWRALRCCQDEKQFRANVAVNQAEQILNQSFAPKKPLLSDLIPKRKYQHRKDYRPKAKPVPALNPDKLLQEIERAEQKQIKELIGEFPTVDVDGLLNNTKERSGLQNIWWAFHCGDTDRVNFEVERYAVERASKMLDNYASRVIDAVCDRMRHINACYFKLSRLPWGMRKYAEQISHDLIEQYGEKLFEDVHEGLNDLKNELLTKAERVTPDISINSLIKSIDRLDKINKKKGDNDVGL